MGSRICILVGRFIGLRCAMGALGVSLLCLAACGTAQTIAQTKECAEGERIVLVGEVFRLAAFGAPNFGENPATDAKENYFVVRVSHPLTIRPYEGRQITGVDTFQLVFSPQDDALREATKRFVQKRRVQVVGKIMAAVSGHHHERALLGVESIQAFDGPSR